MELPVSEEWNHDDWTYCFLGGENVGGVVFHTATVPTEVAPGFKAEDVAEVVHFYGVSPEGFASRELYAVCRLTNDRWASVYAWSDTTGWGCQDGVTWHIGDSYDQVVLWGLDDDGRSALGLESHTVDMTALVADLRELDRELKRP